MFAPLSPPGNSSGAPQRRRLARACAGRRCPGRARLRPAGIGRRHPGRLRRDRPGSRAGRPGRARPAPAVRVVTAGGMAGWQITLIALGAALVAAAAAVVLDRARPPAGPPPRCPAGGTAAGPDLARILAWEGPQELPARLPIPVPETGPSRVIPARAGPPG